MMKDTVRTRGIKEIEKIEKALRDVGCHPTNRSHGLFAGSYLN